MVSNQLYVDASDSGTYTTWVADKLAGQPQEWLLKVVVGLSGHIVVLEVLLAVERDGLGLDLALLHVDLVTDKADWDVLANADQVTYTIVSAESRYLRISRDAYGASLERSCM